MKVRLFAIRLVSESFVSDQRKLNEFLDNVEFIKSDSHFVESATNYWSVLVHFEEKKIDVKSEVNTKKNLIEIKEQDLSEEQHRLYVELKIWRNKKAQDWSIPSYMICHNSEMLDAIVTKPKTISELKKIKGFGDVKIENHGEEILTLINAK